MASTVSANMDLRSFKLNFEVNAFIYDKNIIDEIKKKFLEDLKHGKELKQNMFENRKIVNKIKESVCRLFSPIL